MRIRPLNALVLVLVVVGVAVAEVAGWLGTFLPAFLGRNLRDIPVTNGPSSGSWRWSGSSCFSHR